MGGVASLAPVCAQWARDVLRRGAPALGLRVEAVARGAGGRCGGGGGGIEAWLAARGLEGTLEREAAEEEAGWAARGLYEGAGALAQGQGAMAEEAGDD